MKMVQIWNIVVNFTSADKKWVFRALDYIFGVSEKMFLLRYNISFKFYPSHGSFFTANTFQEAVCSPVRVDNFSIGQRRLKNVKLLFSAHISYGKGKYLNQTGFFFFLQNLPRFYLYLNLRVLPIEFNPHKFSFVRYVFVEIFEVFFKK